MNYIPLYRKYRPQKLNEVVGQEHIKKSLTNAIELDKISHAFMFTGPRGTGKTSTARIFAKSLNCKEGPTISPCGVCENCVDITNSTPLDVIEIDAASNRKVEDAQNILERVMYAPVNSRYKIYIIDEVHMLSTHAFNALLKTLEEPPKNVIFILATTDVQKVPDTIKSRCQRFDFKRITTNDIVKHLRYIADNEKINITDDALFTIAKNSAGGMRDSIALLDQLSILGTSEAITTEDINNLLGRLSFDALNELTESIINSQPQNSIESLEKVYNSGNEPVQILINLMDYLKNVLIVKTCKKDIAIELTQANEEQLKVLKSQADKVETHQIISLVDKCSDYVRDLKESNNPRLWLEVGIIDLANLVENTTLAELQNRLARLEGGEMPQTARFSVKNVNVKPVQSSKPEPAELHQDAHNDDSRHSEIVSESKEKQVIEKTQTETVKKNDADFSPMPKSKPVEGADIAVYWGQLLENIQSPPTRALLKQWAKPVKIAPDETVLTMKNEIFLNQVQSGAKKQSIIQAVDNLFDQSNSNVVIRLPQAGDDAVRQPTVAPVQPKPKIESKPIEPQEVEELKAEVKEMEIEKKLENRVSSPIHSDNVNMVIDLFDGKVID